MQKSCSLKSNCGSALVFAVVFSAVFSIVGVGTISLISGGNQLHTRDVKIIKSYWANEGAMRVALRYLTRAASHPPTIPDFNADSIIVINGYRPTVNIVASTSNSYDIKTTQTVDNMANTTTIDEASFNTFSRYTWFMQGPFFDQRGNPSRWHAAVIDGNFHSNDDIYLSSSMTDVQHVIPPGEATCAGNYDEGGHPEEYGKGLIVSGNKNLDWFRSRIPKYSSVDPISTDGLAPEEGAFDDGWNIEEKTSTNFQKYLLELKVDGGVAKVNIYGSNSSSNDWEIVIMGKELSDVAPTTLFGGVITSDAHIHVAGTLKGQLTIVSGAGMDVVIAGDILYDGVNAGEMPEINDPNMLGLVSGADIIVQGSYNLYKNKEGSDVDDFPYGDWGNDETNIYASLFASEGYLKPSLSGWSNNGNDVNIYGSYLIDRQGGTLPQYTIHAYGDPRYMQNIVSPPGIPDVKTDDQEMLVHWKDAAASGGAKSYPINILTWKNEIL